MFLKRLILINWGNIPKLELEFGPVNLFSGGNGSGKTTAADAIQALMTAAHENLFAFNPGQDETTQRGRGGKQVRTLASYLMGCDDGSYARLDPTEGYVAGVFHPTQGENSERFTAVLAMQGHIDKASHTKQARLDHLAFYILPGEMLSLSDFIRQQEGEKHLTPIKKIEAEFKKLCPSVETFDKKGGYLRRLYAALRGKKEAVTDREAKHAARTFSGFMAYKPVKSIHEFVAQEILEPRDLGEAIRSVSDLMKTISSMEANAASIKASIATLEDARQLSGQYIQHWLEQKTTQYTQACHQAWLNQQVYLAAKNQQAVNRQLIEECQERNQIAAERKHHILARMVDLQAQRQGIQSLRDKDALMASLAQQNKLLAEAAQPLALQVQQLKNNVQAAEELLTFLQQHSVAADIPALEKPAFLQHTKQIAQNKMAADMAVSQLLNRDWVDISPLEAQLDAILSLQTSHQLWVDALEMSPSAQALSIKEHIKQWVASRIAFKDKLAQDMRRLSQEISLRHNQQLHYPAFVEQALRTLHEQLPQADARVLCDYVEVTDPHWQMAIEGYIGGGRFSIIVDAHYEAEAIRTLRSMKGGRSAARIVQASKAKRDAEKLSPPKHSVLEVMAFTHASAQAYIQASYGSVLRVDSAETLRNTARGITAEGMGSGNYSLFRCDLDDGDLVFGQGARQRALKAKQLELDKLQQQAQAAEAALTAAQQLAAIMAKAGKLDLAQSLHGLLQATRAIAATEARLETLNAGESHALEAQLAANQQEFLQHENQGRQFEQELGRLLEKQKQDDKRVDQCSAEQDRLLTQQEAMEQWVYHAASLYPRFDAEAEVAQCEAIAQATGPEGAGVFEQQLKTLQDSLNRKERQLFEAIAQHNQQAALADKVVYDTGYATAHSAEFFQHLVSLGAVLEQLHNRLKNNILVEKHRQLVQLKESFNTAFVSNLCHSIYQAINEGKRILDDLNKELKHHCFGADRETFYFDVEWVPEYQEYWQFFKTLIQLPNLGEGASLFEVELPPKFARTRDQLLSMLLDADEQTAHRELARISDYRNYRRYEIYKHPENKSPIALSQYGTGSGGQLETPAYIIRSAAITSAFRFNEGNSHMRMVMVDEAFSKMDEGRSREVIRYLTESLGLQLIFIMPTSKSGPFLDVISNQFVFTKCPTQEPVGELKTRVLVDRKVCNSEHIQNLWAQHRKTIRHQALLDFMEDVPL